MSGWNMSLLGAFCKDRGEAKPATFKVQNLRFSPVMCSTASVCPYLTRRSLLKIPVSARLSCLCSDQRTASILVSSSVHAPSFVEHAVAGHDRRAASANVVNHIRKYELPAFDLTSRQKIANLLWEVHDGIAVNEAAIEWGGP